MKRTFSRPDKDTIAWEMRDLPDDVVVISFSVVSGGGASDAAPTSFPLSIDNLMVDDSPRDPHDPPFPRRFRPVFASWCENYCLLEVWIGTKAPASRRQAAAELVASVQPPL